MPNQILATRVEAAQRDVSDAEEALRQVTLPGQGSRDDVVAVARAKLMSARELLRELNDLLATAQLEQASEAVVEAERNLTNVLEGLLAPTRKTVATAAVLDALERLDNAKARLGEVQAIARAASST